MSKISSPISLFELGSTHVNISIYDEFTSSNNLHYEEKLEYTDKQNFFENDQIQNSIVKAEKDLGIHLNEIILLIDSANIKEMNFTIQKNFDKKIITNDDINYLVKESEQIVKASNKDLEVLHIFKNKIILDNNSVEELEIFSQEVYKATIEIKFITIEKIIYKKFQNIFKNNHINVKKIFCTSYIKSIGLINKMDINGFNSFIDIGHKKSCLTIFKDKKLLYLNSIHLGGNHVTNDIAKILKINYRKAEAEKLKFSKKNTTFDSTDENDLLRKIINSRIEEIIELLFLNCSYIKDNFFNNNLRLFFLGNGSKVLNENLLSFGNEFSFIEEMSIIDENKQDCLYSALVFNKKNENLNPQKLSVSLENKGFFEKFFEYFSRN